jgi:arabinogalactan endo-1,4-beta-galactosidase
VTRRSCLAALVLLIAPSGGMVQVACGEPFYMGADISLTTFMQQQNVTFTDNGAAKPLDRLLYDRGVNLFRLRIFVNPPSSYTNQNFGAIQSQAYDIALAQQIKANAPGAKLMLDFHYSDTWADPGDQLKPAAWNNLSLAQLQTTVQNYTRDTLLAFKDAGVMPDLVQVGNEISSGMLFGVGTGSNSAGGRLVFSGSTIAQRASWQNLGSLLNSAIQGVRAAQGTGPKIDVAIHIDKGDQDDHPQYYFGNLTNPTWGNVSDFDIVGVSYYPSTQAFHSFALLESNLEQMIGLYPGKKMMILEANYPWRTSSVGIPQWPSTPAGQQQFLTDLRDMMLGLSNGAGAGIVYWYPEAVQVPGYNIYNGGSTALFDSSRAALPALGAFDVTLQPGDFNRDGAVDVADYVVWRKGFGTIFTQTDYDVWLVHFGETNGAVSGAIHAEVPEPAVILLVVIGSFVMMSTYRCHRDGCKKRRRPILLNNLEKSSCTAWSARFPPLFAQYATDVPPQPSMQRSAIRLPRRLRAKCRRRRFSWVPFLLSHEYDVQQRHAAGAARDAR